MTGRPLPRGFLRALAADLCWVPEIQADGGDVLIADALTELLAQETDG